MAFRLTSSLWRPSLLRTLVSQARLAWRLVREPAVPLILKTIPFLGIVYVVSPLDFVPDIIPVLGQLDDLGIVLVALEAFLRLCPAAAAGFHRAAIARGQAFSRMPGSGDIIDAEFRREDGAR